MNCSNSSIADKFGFSFAYANSLIKTSAGERLNKDMYQIVINFILSDAIAEKCCSAIILTKLYGRSYLS